MKDDLCTQLGLVPVGGYTQKADCLGLFDCLAVVEHSVSAPKEVETRVVALVEVVEQVKLAAAVEVAGALEPVVSLLAGWIVAVFVELELVLEQLPGVSVLEGVSTAMVEAAVEAAAAVASREPVFEVEELVVVVVSALAVVSKDCTAVLGSVLAVSVPLVLSFPLVEKSLLSGREPGAAFHPHLSQVAYGGPARTWVLHL
jgi:hypothetical protein